MRALPLLAGLLVVAACAPGGPEVPDPDLSELEPRVASRMVVVREDLLAHPDSAEAWGLFGKVCDIHRLYADAAVCYARAQELDPHELRWPYFHARVASIVSEDPQEAIRLYEEAAVLGPAYAPLHVRLGEAYVRVGRTVEAQKAFVRALELDRGLLRAHRGLAQTLLADGGVDSAIERLEEARQRFPEDATTLLELARAYGRKGLEGRAREAEERAAALAPDDRLPDPLMAEVAREGLGANLFGSRASDAMAAGDWPAAIENLREALASRPDDPGLLYNLAVSLEEAGEPDAAIEELRRLTGVKDDSSEVRMRLARLLGARGDVEEAVEHGRRAAELAPDDADLHASLARALAGLGSHEEANVHYARAAEHVEPSASLLNAWGVSLHQAGEISTAVERYRAALAADPGYANAHFNLGLVFEQIENREQALSHYRSALEIEPGHAAAAERIRELGG